MVGKKRTYEENNDELEPPSTPYASVEGTMMMSTTKARSKRVKTATFATESTEYETTTSSSGAGPADELLANAKRERLQLILEEFDLEVASRVRKMETLTEDLCNNLRREFRTQIVRCPKEVQKMSAEEFFNTYNGSIEVWREDQKRRARENIRSATALPPSAPSTSSSSNKGPVVPLEVVDDQNEDEDDFGPKRFTVTSTVKKVPKSGAAAAEATPGTVRKSSRAAAEKASEATAKVFETPSQRGGRARTAPGTVDKAAAAEIVPHTPRLPRADELVMSVNGSPLGPFNKISTVLHTSKRKGRTGGVASPLPEIKLALPNGTAIDLTNPHAASALSKEAKQTALAKLVALQAQVASIMGAIGSPN